MQVFGLKKILALSFVSLILFGCMGIGTTPIEELSDNPSTYVGKEVHVTGTVENTMKIGTLSGYTLTDDDGNSVRVSSKALPAEGSKLTVSGVFLKDSLFGYYIQVAD